MRYLPFAVLAVATIYTLVDCVRSDRAQIRALPRVVWFVLILVVPVFGVVLWFLFGRPQAIPEAAPAVRPLAPDDDPRFLSDLAERQRRERAARRATERAAEQKRADEAAAEQKRAAGESRQDQHPDRNGRNPAQGSAGAGTDENTGS
ncbi:hypothetical protein BKD30_04375 [Tersicoccus phoenicis]|uniref:Cardiolipin synthase N-terminal domain-containing protein n=1 Tax=Tersicoccus phoenicis TaxID=554083 RepID=A0A1R1LHG1_9MICC|nr:PLD nuclease N-terminal domain-containing protein [Tersicoccus phoenicis]OMH26984.1 hypothetical protein BKD30_04375 [Tersicoccus phoenicis]